MEAHEASAAGILMKLKLNPSQGWATRPSVEIASRPQYDGQRLPPRFPSSAERSTELPPPQPLVFCHRCAAAVTFSPPDPSPPHSVPHSSRLIPPSPYPLAHRSSSATSSAQAQTTSPPTIGERGSVDSSEFRPISAMFRTNPGPLFTTPPSSDPASPEITPEHPPPPLVPEASHPLSSLSPPSCAPSSPLSSAPPSPRHTTSSPPPGTPLRQDSPAQAPPAHTSTPPAGQPEIPPPKPLPEAPPSLDNDSCSSTRVSPPSVIRSGVSPPPTLPVPYTIFEIPEAVLQRVKEGDSSELPPATSPHAEAESRSPLPEAQCSPVPEGAPSGSLPPLSPSGRITPPPRTPSPSPDTAHTPPPPSPPSAMQPTLGIQDGAVTLWWKTHTVQDDLAHPGLSATQPSGSGPSVTQSKRKKKVTWHDPPRQSSRLASRAAEEEEALPPLSSARQKRFALTRERTVETSVTVEGLKEKRESQPKRRLRKARHY